jgi:hypothetical protein
MKPPDSITDGVVVLRFCRRATAPFVFVLSRSRHTRSVAARGGGRGGPLNQPARRIAFRVVRSAVMKPPDSITDGVVVLRKMREGDRVVFFSLRNRVR